jgi:cell wall-associated NlpC family hydrolase
MSANILVQQQKPDLAIATTPTNDSVIQRFPPILTGTASLLPGDIVFTYDPEFKFDTHQLIKIGQLLTGKWSDKRWQYVHAAIYTGDEQVIEATGGKSMKVVEQEGIPAEYIAFRYQGDAAESVKSLAIAYARTKSDQEAEYSILGALGSILKSSHRGWASEAKELRGGEGTILTKKFYCSNLVVRAYNQAWVMNAVNIGDMPLARAIIDDPPINVDADYISPGKLVGVLDKSDKWMGVQPV